MQSHRDDRDSFADRLFRSALGYFDLLSIRLGQRLGMYEVLADQGAMTSAELAERTGTAERYAREWLEQQVTARILRANVRRKDPTFSLPPGHAEVLLDGDSLSYMGASVWQLLTIPNAFENVVEAFRTGGGVSYEAYGRDNVQGQGLGNRPILPQHTAERLAPEHPTDPRATDGRASGSCGRRRLRHRLVLDRDREGLSAGHGGRLRS
jgi:hypothetical protein